jgi:hypothetical protein
MKRFETKELQQIRGEDDDPIFDLEDEKEVREKHKPGIQPHLS